GLMTLALHMATSGIALIWTSARHLVRRSLALRAAGLLLGAAALAAGGWFLGDGWALLSRSDRSTLEAVLPLLAGRPGALAAAAVGFALGIAVVVARRRPWRALVGLVVAGVAARRVLGGPRVQRG